MKYLHVIVWQYNQDETEWTHIVSERKYLTIQETREAIDRFMTEVMEMEPEDYDLGNYWESRIEAVDGYEIKLEKEAQS